MNKTGTINVYDALFNRLSTIISLIIIAVSFAMPPDGIGFEICIYKRFLGFLCPGCGLSRSISSTAHLQFSKAFSYHPFGPVLYPFLFFLAGHTVLGGKAKKRIRLFVASREPLIRSLYIVFIYSFITFGAGRALYCFFI